MLKELRYRVYRGFLTGSGEAFTFAVSTVRVVSLRQEINRGERLMEIGDLLLETADRNEAIRLADGVEF